jgi:hypothetical protein
MSSHVVANGVGMAFEITVKAKPHGFSDLGLLAAFKGYDEVTFTTVGRLDTILNTTLWRVNTSLAAPNPM